MQSSTVVHGVPFAKKPRNGQVRVFDEIIKADNLNVKLPTGYGKTITGIGSYAIRRKAGNVNRLLFIVPTVAQLDQFVKDAPGDLRSVGITDNISIVDINFYGHNALRKHRRSEAHVFSVTVQTLCTAAGSMIVKELLSTGDWMVVVDEYHHYGDGKRWGDAVVNLPRKVLLAMSATPYRKDDDSAFGAPNIDVKYKDAQREGAVKKLRGHSYNYRVDAQMPDGSIKTFTTAEIADEAGGDSPEKIETYKITRQMRWSAKYVSPLVSVPLTRLLQQRLVTGLKLQAIFGAMCVSHAQQVCEQIQGMFPNLSVDWVGTGQNGRSDKDNSDILARFCPPKDQNGERNPDLDVLVHVGMAGEGMDSTLVTEVVHLNKASKNNSNDQENGRAARFLIDVNGKPVDGHINFDASSDYAKWVGTAIMDAMDDEEPSSDDEGDDEVKDRGEGDYQELPDLPSIRLWNMELLNINSGDESVQLTFRAIEEGWPNSFPFEEMKNNPDHPVWEKMIVLTKGRLTKEAEQYNEVGVINQWRDSVDTALGAVTSLAIRAMTANGVRAAKSIAGDVKKRINTRKKAECGSVENDVEKCKRHYQWLKALEQTILKHGVPEWLR